VIRAMVLFGLSKLDHNLDPVIILDALRRSIGNKPITDFLCQAAGELKIPGAIPLLERIISKPSWDGNYDAILALEQIGGTEAGRALLKIKNKWWDGEDFYLQNHDLIFSALQHLGDDQCVEAIIECGNDPKAIKRYMSDRFLDKLTGISNPSACPSLMVALSHPNPTVRHNSIIALARMQYEKAIPRIIGLMNDEINYVREVASTAITRWYKAFREPTSVAALESMLQSTDNSLRYIALDGLHKARRNLIHYDTFSRIRGIIETEPDNYLFREAVSTLADIGDINTFQYLWDLLTRISKQIPPSSTTDRRWSDVYRQLGRSRFLPFLVKHFPTTLSLLKRICEANNIRILNNGRVVFSEGLELSTEDAAGLLWQREGFGGESPKLARGSLG
jgi:HEAT repeat protein